MRSRRLAGPALAMLALTVSCAATPPGAADSAGRTAEAGRADEAGARSESDSSRDEPRDESERYVWSKETRSPHPLRPDPGDSPLLGKCGQSDAALRDVARRVARRQGLDLPGLDMPEVAFALRAAGSPYVWARAWTVQGKALADEDVQPRMERWLETFDDGGERRCGVGRFTDEAGVTTVAVLALDAVADLEPLPTTGRVGRWLKVEARTLQRPREAKVVVLGPRGAPRQVPTSVDGNSVRASFSADQAGAWLVQVLADVGSGPRPVAEAMVHVDTAAPKTFRGSAVPGEKAAHEADDDRDALANMVNAVRREEGLSRLRRDRRLDALAQAHADAMHEQRRIGHDVGTGTLPDRIAAAGLTVRVAGENLARAMDIRRAHRALWSSPSHRGNLLHAGFDAIGIGVVRDGDGTVWACQVFATF